MTDKEILSQGYNSLAEDCSSKLDIPSASQIIIDEVNVAGCVHFWNIGDAEGLKICKINFENYYYSNGTPYGERCKKHPNCYFKQLRRKEQECKKQSWELGNLSYKIKNQRKEINERLKQLDKAEQDYIDLLRGSRETVKRLFTDNEKLKEKYKWYEHYKESALLNKDLCNKKSDVIEHYMQVLKQIKSIAEGISKWGFEASRNEATRILDIINEVKDETISH